MQGINVKTENLTAHLLRDRYGDFWLTDAIRPSLNEGVTPAEGYRVETYRDRRAGFKVPVLVAAISRERLFDVFLDLLDPLGETLDVVLETSHETDGTTHQDLFREHMDASVFKSYCCEFEELLLHDGCTGIAALSTTGPMEVQFDEHKLLVIYAPELEPFVEVMERHGIRRDDCLRLITEGEHLHSTDPKHHPEFEQLACRLGVGEAVERVSW
jgi:hypothetical protein